MDVFAILGVLVGVLLLLLLLILARNIYEVKNLSGWKPIPCSAILYLVPIIIIIPLTIFYVIFFALYRKLVSLILKIKYKSKFLGLIRSRDAFHTMVEPSESLIHTLVMWEDLREKSNEDLHDELKKIAYDLLSASPITNTIFKKAFGYTYMLKEELTMDDCVKTMKTANCSKGKLSKEQLLHLINECHTSPLSKNDSVWGEAIIGTQPVNWKDDGKSYYPLLFRTHHGICGGVTLMKILTGSFADYNPDGRTQKDNGCVKVVKDDKPHRGLSLLTNLLMGFRVWLLAPATIYSSLVAKGNDSNVLCGPKLTGQVHLGLRVEESPGYVEKIKRIKEKAPGVSFYEVVLAAFSASLAEYFGKNSTSRPEFTTTALPLLASAANLHRLVPGEFDVRTVKMENNHSLALMNLPMFVKGDGIKSSLIERLKLFHNESTIFRNSVSPQVNRVLMLLCGYSPQLVVRLASHIWSCTTLISIVPGTQKVTYKQGSLVLADLIYWIPHLYSIGLGLSVMSYDGRLQVGFRVDKALISNAKDVQSVVDGIYRYIDLLEEEIDSTSHNK